MVDVQFFLTHPSQTWIDGNVKLGQGFLERLSLKGIDP